jgi:hypothetical protein
VPHRFAGGLDAASRLAEAKSGRGLGQPVQQADRVGGVDPGHQAPFRVDPRSCISSRDLRFAHSAHSGQRIDQHCPRPAAGKRRGQVAAELECWRRLRYLADNDRLA